YILTNHLFSCVLAVFLCLASCEGATRAQGSQRVQQVRISGQDRQRLQQLLNLSRRAKDSNSQLKVTHETVQIYKKYSGRAATDNEKITLNNRVRDFESKIQLVDGVPRQGGAFWETIKGATGQVPPEVWENAQNLFKTSSKTLVEGIVKYLMDLII
ncbi:hypothetical protein KR054_010126, partial [Drosophila jambulina]